MAFEFDLNTVLMAEGVEEFERQTDSPDEVVISQPIFENMKNYTSSDEVEFHLFFSFFFQVINQTIGDEELDPEEEMCFGTLEDVRPYYYRYAVRTGFVVKIRTTGWETKNGQKVVVNQALYCNRDGYCIFHIKAPKRRKIVPLTNCKACCYLALDKMTGQWNISRVEVSHSHLLTPKLSGIFLANRQLSMHVKDLIQQNNQASIRPSKTYQALANATGGPVNLTFTEKDLNTCIKRIMFESKSKDPFERDWYDFIEEYDLHNFRWPNGSIISRFIAACVWLLYRCYFIMLHLWVNLRYFFAFFVFFYSLKNMFADQHMWMPTGMRSTQRNESMPVIFDKYLNSKSYLLQFVRQYKNCLIDKEQNELECDATDLRGIIPCVSRSPIEK
ncbi:hypothetical protein Ahy_A10g048661 [Arachis hypogaea]|uniref:FAR1 domain-containing protein n=1 Tax=Arachis hypogaea TaxID=3818 RepID=A0A445B5L2_ARAHY|nr:hypothetical protein Ahy_A10g048661 [Arachis hypogaea]